MNARVWKIALGLALAVVLLTDAVSQEQAPDMAKMMEAMQKYATPGENHKALGYFVGKWDTVNRMVMPGMPKQVTKGLAEFRWLFPGKFLAQEYKGTFMGMPHEGFGITGFDNYKNKYVQVWVDSMGTAMYWTEGPVIRDAAGKPTKTMAVFGNMDEYMTGEHDRPVKYVTEIVDKDKFLFTVWDLAMGKNGTQVMEITYTRKK